MAPKDGQKVGGGGFLDFAELTEDGPVVCLFHIVEFHEPEPGDYGPKVPVTADVLICDGERAGEVVLGEYFFGAPSGPLRGVKNPKKGDKFRDIAEPVNEVGDELIFRTDYIERKGSQSFVGFDPPSRADSKVANEAYAELAERFPSETAGDVDWDAVAENGGGRPERDADEEDEPPARTPAKARTSSRAAAKDEDEKPARRAARKPWGVKDED